MHRQKFNEFQSEIQSDYRLALLYPTFFMLRRIVYSIILVFMLILITVVAATMLVLLDIGIVDAIVSVIVTRVSHAKV